MKTIMVVIYLFICTMVLLMVVDREEEPEVKTDPTNWSKSYPDSAIVFFPLYRLDRSELVYIKADTQGTSGYPDTIRVKVIK